MMHMPEDTRCDQNVPAGLTKYFQSATMPDFIIFPISEISKTASNSW